MNTTPQKLSHQSQIFFLCVFLLILWGGASIAWWSLRWHTSIFQAFDSALPVITLVLLQLTEYGLSFQLAGLLTIVVLYIKFKKTNKLYAAAAWSLCLYMLYIIMVVFAMTIPLVPLCGEYLPSDVGSEAHLSTQNVKPCVH
ncbi:MAG: hypothetical protein HOM11_05475 [Methylococcales bacterium]|jgi:hypothetical protein|nr:hypothetical protein [Methylococcales bacterium]MBT7442539.1 hypothetical protein [Methylococcales bacterium]